MMDHRDLKLAEFAGLQGDESKEMRRGQKQWPGRQSRVLHFKESGLYPKSDGSH